MSYFGQILRSISLLLIVFISFPLSSASLKPAEIQPFLNESLKPFTDSGNLKGIVAGVVLRDQDLTGAWGSSGVPGLDLDKNTVFEIASVTKTFNGLLLAQLVAEKKMALDDPLQKYMPAGIKVPDWKGRQVTLLNLVTHTSGLPVPGPADHFLPAWYTPKGLRLIFLHVIHWNFSDPTLGLGEKDIYDFVNRCQLKQEPGTRWEYCNLGMGLLGLAMVRADGQESYEQLLRKRIAGPLGMDSTWINLPEALKPRQAQGYNEAGKKAPKMSLGLLAAAGGLKSSLEDLMKYARLQLGMSGDDALRSAVRDSHTVRFTLKEGDFTRPLPLAWHKDFKTGMLFHSGTGLGYHSWIGLMEDKGVAVVLLSNSAAQVVEEIGPELLKKIVGLEAQVPRPLVAIHLPQEALRRLEGKYRLDKTLVDIRRNGDHLDVSFGDKKPSALWPRSELSFFCKEWDCRMEFKVAEDGQLTGVDIKMYYNSYFAAREK